MISTKEVQHIAKLARLGLTKKEEELFKKELSTILDYFETLKELDVSKTEPTFHPSEYFFKRNSPIMREDKTESQPVEIVAKLVKASPDKKEGYIKVKAVL